VGNGGKAASGENGELRIRWWDDRGAGRYRLVVGYVGEDSVKAGVYYRVENGKLVSTGERVKK
jgi:hypothetical protein